MRRFLCLFAFLFVSFFLISCDEIPNINEIEFTITFETNGGTTINPMVVNKDSSIQIPNDPTKPDFIFDGWYTDEDFTTIVSWPLILTDNITLYAKWTPITATQTYCDVIFDTQGGSTINQILIESGKSITQPANPVKSGYQFLGWYLDAELTQDVNFPLMIENHLTLYAKWEEIDPNQLKLTTYDFTTINIARMIPATFFDDIHDDFVFISSEGKLFTLEGIFNQSTQQIDTIFIEVPVPFDEIYANERIVDAIVYDPVYLIKTESGKWFGFEMGEFATGDFLGSINRLVSLDELFNLAPSETIVQINNADRFFYAFTSENQVFIYGSLYLGSEQYEIANGISNITSEFDLEDDEYFIANDIFSKSIGYEALHLKTNKRVFIPKIIASSLLDNTNILSIPKYFIDINEMDDNTYIDAILIHLNHRIVMQMVSDQHVYEYMMDSYDMFSRTYDISILENEKIRFVGPLLITDQNRLFSGDSFQHINVDGMITELIASYYDILDDNQTFTPIIKTHTGHYYLLEGMTGDIVELTDDFNAYELRNGFLWKDDIYYIYHSELEEIIHEDYQALEKVTTWVNKDTIIIEPTLNHEYYVIDSWLNMPQDYIIRENLTLYPIINVPEFRELMVRIFVDDINIYDGIANVVLDKTYDVEEVIDVTLNQGYFSINTVIDLSYLFVENMIVNEDYVEQLIVTENTYYVSIYLSKNENVTTFNMRFENEYGYQKSIRLYRYIGDPINLDDFAQYFDYPIIDFYQSTAYDLPFEKTQFENNMIVYVKLDYPIEQVTFVFSHEVPSLTMDYVSGYSPNINKLYEKFSRENSYEILGFFTDLSYTNQIYEWNNLNSDAIVYVKLGQIIHFEVEGDAGYLFMKRTYESIEGNTFEEAIRSIEYNRHISIGFYYDEALTQEINMSDLIPIDLKNVYVKFEEIEHKTINVIVIGHEEVNTQVKHYIDSFNVKQSLDEQFVFVNHAIFYTSSSNGDTFSIYNHVDYENIPNVLYINPFETNMFIFTNETYGISFVFFGYESEFDHLLRYNIIDILDFDAYQIMDSNQNIISSTDSIIYDSFGSYELNFILNPRTNINITIDDQLYTLDDISIGYSIKEYNEIFEYIYNELMINQIVFDDFEIYMDSSFSQEWNQVVTEDMTIYVKVIYYPRTTLTLDINGDHIYIEGVIVGRENYDYSNRLYNYFDEHNMIYDEYQLYEDQSFTDEWDHIVDENQIVYVKIIQYQKTNIQIVVDNMVYTINDVNAYRNDWSIEYEIHELLENEGYFYDRLLIFYDEEQKHPFRNIVIEDATLYVELFHFEIYTIKMYILEEEIILDDIRFNDEVFDYLYFYLDDHNINLSIYSLLVCTDSQYQDIWDGNISQGLNIYVELLNRDVMTTLTLMYQNEIISQQNHNLGYLSFGELFPVMQEYLVNNNIPFNDIKLFFDAELKKEWNNIVREDLVIHINAIAFEPTTITVIFESSDPLVFTLNKGYNRFSVEQAIHFYLGNHEIEFDYFDIYLDDTYQNIWNDDFIYDDMVFYVDVISYPRTTIFIHINEQVLEFNDIILGEDYNNLVYNLTQNYIEEQDILYDGFNMYWDEGCYYTWDYLVYDMMDIYVKVVYYPRTQVTIDLGQDEVVTFDDVMLNGYNAYEVYEWIRQYASNHELYFDEIELYIDSSYSISWNHDVDDNMILYAKLISFTLDEKFEYYFGDQVIYYEVSDELNAFFTSNINGDDLVKQAYIVLFPSQPLFSYVIMLSKDSYYMMAFYQEYYMHYATLEDALNGHYYSNEQLITSTELSYEELLSNEMFLSSYPDGVESYEDLLNLIYLHPYVNVHFYQNEWLVDEDYIQTLEIVIELYGQYLVWNSIYSMLT